MKEKEIEKIFKALANRRRISIVGFLKSKKIASVGGIAHHIKLSFRSTSKHLLILSGANIIEKEQVGPTVNYYLVESPHAIVKKLLELL